MRVSRGGSYVSGEDETPARVQSFCFVCFFSLWYCLQFSHSSLSLPSSILCISSLSLPPPPQFVQPTGKRFLLALDVSGSMGSYNVLGSASINARVASAAMSMVTARTEANYKIVGFSHHLVPLNIKASMSLEEVIQTIERVSVSSSSSSKHKYPVYHPLRSIPTLIFCHRCPWGEQTVLSQ